MVTPIRQNQAHTVILKPSQRPDTARRKIEVSEPGCFTGQVVIEPDEHFQLGEGLLAGVDPAQRVWQGPGRVSDHT